MIHLILAFLSILFMWKSFASGGAIEEVQWNHRLIAYVLDDEASIELLQSKIAESRHELEDRDLLLVNLGNREIEGYPSLQLSETEKELWRNLWHFSTSETRFVLVGKDGGAKAMQGEYLDLSLFMDQIDSMPMRQAEVNRARAD